MYGESSTVASASSGGMSTEIATTSGFAHHHVGDVLVPEVEDAFDQLALAVLDLAPRGRAGEEHPQLGLGVHVALGAGRLRGRAPARIRSVAFRSSQITGPKTTKNPRTGARDPERRPLRMPERGALRHELAEDDVEEGEDRVGEDDREHRRHPLSNSLRQRRLAESADSERGERDAELHRGDEPARVGRDVQDAARAAVALVLQLDDPRPPRRDEAVFRRDEERVEQDQESDPDELQREVSRPHQEGVGTRKVVVHLSRRSIRDPIGQYEHMFAILR